MRETKGRTRESASAFTEKAESRKPAFEVNHFYERVLRLRATNPRDFDALSPAVKISLGAYETAKREAQRLQAIRDEPEAA